MSDVTITPTGFKSEAREITRRKTLNRLFNRSGIKTTVGGGGGSSSVPVPSPSTPEKVSVTETIKDLREKIKLRKDLAVSRSSAFIRSLPERVSNVNTRFNNLFVPSENSSRLAQVSYAGRNENRKVVNESQAFITPKKIRSGFEKTSEFIIDKSKPVSDRIIKNVIDEKYTPGTEQNLFFTKPRVKKSSAKEVLSDVLMFSAFNPLMSSGSVSQYTETITADGRRIFIKKSQVRDYLNRLERSGKTVSSPSLQTKLNRIDFLLKNAKDNQARQELLSLARAEYGDSVVKEYLSQNIGVKTQTATTQTTAQSNVLGLKTTPQTVRTVKLEQSSLVSASVTTAQNNVLGLKPKSETVKTVKSKQDTQQKNIFMSSPNVRTASQTSTTNKTDSKQDSKTALRFFSSQTTVQRPRLKTGSSNGSSVKKRVTRVTKKLLFPKSSSPLSVSPSSNNKPPIIEEGFLTQIKKSGKWRTIGKKPLTKSQALAFGGYLTDNTVSASFRIKKTDEQPVKSSFSTFKSSKYRKSKKDKNVFVEKKSFRIDTSGEKRGLTVAKLLKGTRKKKKKGFFL